ncbi:hypothetical protein [Salinirussus salinus]|uniref:hypothetical protein n=1 Tax=Salinirussus salinus TaxID=1198300 RepID=UPI001357CE00|nr:hypothetical protein [Salinirussus salinus]
MGAIPGSIETDAQPPMAVPLRHFLVGLAALLAGGALGLAAQAGLVAGLAGLAHVHLLLVGWVCVTVMGAMTQFVPVWSGVDLHSRRLATLQLWLVTVGLTGFVAALLWPAPDALPAFGALMLAGFWTFAYNIARSLPREMDVTERHFALALGFFVLLTVLGVVLAAGYTTPLLADLGLARPDAVAAHATLAVFGAVLTTVVGAIYQLGTMFTRTDMDRVDRLLQRVETVAYPVGVLALAAGRLADVPVLARAGGVLVVGGLAAAFVVVGRKLLEARVPWTPMLSRYAVAVAAALAWAALTLPAWLAAPTTPDATFGAPGAAHLLAAAVVGFVVLGTLYHVVPFIVWVHRYSDLLGFEDVPMIDDLYDARVARADFLLLVAALLLLTADGLVGLPDAAVAVAGTAFLVGAALFVGNMALVVREHSPDTVGGILAGRTGGSGGGADTGRGGPGD